MVINWLKSGFSFFIQHRQDKILLYPLFALFFTPLNNSALAVNFITYNGGIDVESDWQADAGNTMLEDFESFSVGSQISSLPALGVRFDSLAGGGFPHIYNHFECCVTPYGSKNLGNFPNGINEINRGDDIVLHVLPEYEITALGFWNGDGQSDTFNAIVYDASDNVLGSIGSFRGTFAGFISDVAISRVVFDGNTGDGWNHLDGLQTNASIVNIPPIADPGPAQIIELGELAMFDGTASFDPDGVIVDYNWDFGDGNSDSNPVTSHLYTLGLGLGDFTANLTVTDNERSTDTASTLVTVEDTTDPVVDIIKPIDGFMGFLGTPISFEGFASDISEQFGGLLSYQWDFGDGSTAMDLDTSHIYNSLGNFDVSFSATDLSGNSSSTNIILSINEPTEPPESTPEASTVLGLITIGGIALGAYKKKHS